MIFNINRTIRTLLLTFAMVWSSQLVAQSYEAYDIDALYGESNGRIDIIDASGTETIDPYQGGLTLEYVDGVILGDGGFNLPITRRYKSTISVTNDSFLGLGWDLHFGRIRGVGSSFVLKTLYCASTPAGTKGGPIFEDLQGNSHILFETNQETSNAGDMTTASSHRVICNDDGTVEITDSNGITYTFGKQDYSPGIGPDGPLIVEFQDVLYATKISDKNGNEFEFEYSLEAFSTEDSTSGPEIPLNRTVFALNRVTQNGSTAADFKYDNALLNKHAIKVLERITHNTRTINYLHRSSASPLGDPQVLTVFPLLLEKASSRGEEGFEWSYTYSENIFFPNQRNVETVTNKYGGKTTYSLDYVYVPDSVIPFQAVTFKSNSDGDEWRYEYDHVNAASILNGTGFAADIDETTIYFPDGRIEKHTYCNARQQTDACRFLNGRILEKNIYDGSLNKLVQTEYFDWVLGTTYTDVRQKIKDFSGFPVFAQYAIRIISLEQHSIKRDSKYYTTNYSDYDRYGLPGDVVEWSSNSRPSSGLVISAGSGRRKQTEFEYDNPTSNWVVGLVKSKVLNEVNDIRVLTNDTMNYDYDSKGNLTEVSTNGIKTTYDHDSKGNVKLVLLPEGHRTVYSDFELGIPQKIEKTRGSPAQLTPYMSRDVNPSSGYILSESDESPDVIAAGGGGTTEYEYDFSGRVKLVKTARNGDSHIDILRKSTSTSTTRGNRVVTKNYDDFSRVSRVSTTDLLENDQTISKDYAYDYLDRLVFESVSHSGNSPSEHGTYYKYDIFGRMIEARYGENSNQSANDSITTYSYDEDKVTITDPLANVTTNEYEAFSDPDSKQLIKISQPENVETTIDRSLRGDIIKVTQNGLTREYFYNEQYQLKTVKHPELTNDINFTYTPNGFLETKSIGSTPVATYYYEDGAGNVTRITYADSETAGTPKSEDVTITYYGDDNVHTQSKGKALWTYTFDKNKNLKTEKLNYDDDIEEVIRFSYTYNELDYLAGMIYPNSNISFEPDIHGRPSKATNISGEYILKASYYPTGQLDTVEYDNGLKIETDLNSRLAPRDISITDPNSTILGFESYTYDKQYNVKTLNSSARPGVNVFGYDQLDQLVSVTNNSQDYLYNYDGHANLTGYEDSHLTNPVTIGYSQSNKVSSVTPVNDIPTRIFTYDTQGNVRQSGSDEYNFDRNNQLRNIKSTITGGESASFAYDGNAKRVSRSRNGVNTIFAYDSLGRLLYERTPLEASSASYIYLQNEMVARVDRYESLIGRDLDADGILDLTEGTEDSDGDGIANNLDTDSDNDGILDGDESAVDSDSDGIPDFLDLDSDSDNILDIDEQWNWEARVGSCFDFIDPIRQAHFEEYGRFIALKYTEFPFRTVDDLDDDNTINERDDDIDGDNLLNMVERLVTDDATDIDCDGLAQWYDRDSDNDTWPDIIEGGDDLDGDGLANYLDRDSDNDGYSDQLQPPLDNGDFDPKYFVYIEGDDISGTDNSVNATISSELFEDLNVVNRKFVLALPNNAPSNLTLLNFSITESLADVNDPENVNAQKCVPNSRGDRFFFSTLPPQNAVETDFQVCSSAAIIPAPAYTGRKFKRYEVLFNIEQESLAGRRAIFEIVRPSRVTSGSLAAVLFRGFYDDLPSANAITDATTDRALDYSGMYSQYVRNVSYAPPANYVRLFDDVDTPIEDVPVTQLDPDCCIESNGIAYHYIDSDGEIIVDFNEVGGRFAVRFQSFYFEDRNLDDPYALEMFAVDGGGNFGQFKWQVDNVLDVHDALGPIPSGYLLFEVKVPSVDASLGEISFIEQYNQPTSSIPYKFLPGALSSAGTVRSSISVAPTTLLEEQGPDSDGDGISDLVEKVILESPIDTDSDGTPDYLDTDSDNDGLLDEYEARQNYLDPPDSDGSGAPDYRDFDSDNDGISDELETMGDPDRDGLGNYIDTDSDNDFIPDQIEGDQDTDSNGIPDYLDRDSDGDLVLDTVEAAGQFDNPPDTDGDGNPDYLDTDSDNDGVSDTDEAAAILDTDNDRLTDAYEIANGLDPNSNDANSDNDGDGLSNIVEFSLGTNPIQADSDSDGIPDGVEFEIGSDALIDDANADSDGDGVTNVDEYQNPSAIGNVVYRINIGGAELNVNGAKWTSDNSFESDITDDAALIYFATSPQAIPASISSNTITEGLFSNGRFGSNTESSIGISLPLVPNTYEVVLYFSEADSNITDVGQRIFNIEAEDELYIDGLDLIETSGSNQAVVRSFTVTTDNSLDISVVPEVGTAVLSGIAVTVAEPLITEPETTSGTEATFASVNDWYNPNSGGGFNVKYTYTLTADDLPTGQEALAWRIDANYVGAGTIVNAWMNGYNGSITHGYSSQTTDYTISNEPINFKPTLSVGDTIEFNFQVNDAGFDVSDFGPTFVSLSEFDAESGPLEEAAGSSAAVSSINSWYDASSGSGGYNVTFSYTFSSNDLPDISNNTLIMDVIYSGPGAIATGWVSGYSGALSASVLNSNHILFSNESNGFKPNISVGDTVNFSIQVNQAPFVETDFEFNFSQ